MENCKGGLKAYWKRRSYERLDGDSGRRRPRGSSIDLGGGKTKKKFWRGFKISPKLRLLTRIRFSPKRIFTRIRDGYVRMMMGFANSGAISGGFGFGGGPAISGFGRRPELKEYDEKAIVQIYRSLLAQSQLMTSADARGAPPAAVTRVGN